MDFFFGCLGFFLSVGPEQDPGVSTAPDISVSFGLGGSGQDEKLDKFCTPVQVEPFFFFLVLLPPGIMKSSR